MQYGSHIVRLLFYCKSRELTNFLLVSAATIMYGSLLQQVYYCSYWGMKGFSVKNHCMNGNLLLFRTIDNISLDVRCMMKHACGN